MARAGIAPGKRGNSEIPLSSMVAYYASIPPQGQGQSGGHHDD